MPSDGVGRLGDTRKTILKSGTSLTGVKALALGALGGGLLSIAPVIAIAQTDDSAKSTLHSTLEVAQEPMSLSGSLSGETRTFDIEAQPLAMALVSFSRISGIDVAIDGVLPDGLQSNAVSGDMTATEALDRMLSQSGLVWQVLNGTTISVIDPSRVSSGTDEFVTTPVLVTARERSLGPNGTPDWVYATPGAVSVVTRESIEKKPPRNMSDIFRETSGVSAVTNNQNPGFVANIRGLQDFGRVNVNIDGARQNYFQSGHGSTGFTYFDPQLMAEAVVEKGPKSGSGGGGVTGGVITLRTVDTEDVLDKDEKFGGYATVTHGTNAYIFAGNAAVSGRFSDKFDMTAAVSRKRLGSYKAGKRDPLYYYNISAAGKRNDYRTDDDKDLINFAQKQASGLLKANVRPFEDHELKLGYVAYHNDYILGQSDSDLAVYEVFNQTLSADYHWDAQNDLIDLEAGVSYNRADNTQNRDPRYNVGTPYDGFENNFLTETIGYNLQNTSFLGNEWLDVGLNYGVEYFVDETTTETTPYGIINNSNSAWFEGPTPSGERDIKSGFVEADTLFADTVRLITGIRYDHYSLNGDTTLYSRTGAGQVGEDLEVDLSESKYLPSFTASFEMFPAIKPYASWKKGFRPPHIVETLMNGFHVGGTTPFIPNANLESEYSTTREVGVNVVLDDVFQNGDGFRMKAAYFDTRIENYIAQAFVYQPGFAIASTSSGYVNLLDPVKFQGSEFEASYDAGKYYVGGAYTFTLNRFNGAYNPTPYPDDTNIIVPNSNMGQRGGLLSVFMPPRHRFSLDAGVRLLDRSLVVGGRMTYVSETNGYGSGLDAYTNTQYNLYDLYASYDLNDNLKVRLNIDNLLDEGYIESMSTSRMPSPGRTATLSITGKF